MKRFEPVTSGSKVILVHHRPKGHLFKSVIFCHRETLESIVGDQPWIYFWSTLAPAAIYGAFRKLLLLNLSALSVQVSHWRDISGRHSSISIKIEVKNWRAPRSQHFFKIEDQRIISSGQFFSEENQRNAWFYIKYSTHELHFLVKSRKIKFFSPRKLLLSVPDLKNIWPSGSKRLLDPIFIEVVELSSFPAHVWFQFIKILLRPGEKLASSGFSFLSFSLSNPAP